jgi:hypothetical protein
MAEIRAVPGQAISKNRSTADPEKESGQNRAGGDSEGKAPLRRLSICVNRAWSRVEISSAGPFSVYGK